MSNKNEINIKDDDLEKVSGGLSLANCIPINTNIQMSLEKIQKIVKSYSLVSICTLGSCSHCGKFMTHGGGTTCYCKNCYAQAKKIIKE